MYLVKSPLLLKWFYPMLTWNKSRKEKIVYLTFDDGPIPNVTTFVLNTLKEHDIRATFFCIGDNIDRHPDVFEAIKADGHSIGNHTYNHLNGWKTDTETYINNVLKCQKLTQSNLFRPPYGRIKPSQVKALQSVFSSQFSVPTTPTENGKLLTSNSKLPTPNSQLQLIMWDLLTGDFDTQISPEKCFQNVTSHIRNGSIIVFHDSIKAFERLQYALPKTLKYLIKNGYQFDTL